MGYFLARLVLQIVLCPSAHAKFFVGWGGAWAIDRPDGGYGLIRPYI